MGDQGSIVAKITKALSEVDPDSDVAATLKEQLRAFEVDAEYAGLSVEELVGIDPLESIAPGETFSNELRVGYVLTILADNDMLAISKVEQGNGYRISFKHCDVDMQGQYRAAAFKVQELLDNILPDSRAFHEFSIADSIRIAGKQDTSLSFKVDDTAVKREDLGELKELLDEIVERSLKHGTSKDAAGRY